MEEASNNNDIESEGSLHDNDDDNNGLESQGHSIPRYCVASTKKSSLATFTVDMINVLIDIEERGDGSDSDVEGEIFEELDEATRAVTVDKRVCLAEEEVVNFSD